MGMEPTQVAKATQELAEDLAEEVFEHADRFVTQSGHLRHFEIFRWLVETQEQQGLISEATLGTAGSRWLLAKTLSETLKDVVRYITIRSAVEKAVMDTFQVLAFANLMQIWRMNDGLQEDDPLFQVLNPEKMRGFES